MGIPIRRDREALRKVKSKANSLKNNYIQVRCSDQVCLLHLAQEKDKQCLSRSGQVA